MVLIVFMCPKLSKSVHGPVACILLHSVPNPSISNSCSLLVQHVHTCVLFFSFLVPRNSLNIQENEKYEYMGWFCYKEIHVHS